MEAVFHRDHRQRCLGRFAALVLFAATGAGPGLGLVLDGEDAVADGEAIEGQRHDGAGAFAGDHLEMVGFAADDAAERDIAVIGAGGIGKGDGGGDFERAGDGEYVVSSAGGGDGGGGALQLGVGDGVVEAGFDDEEWDFMSLVSSPEGESAFQAAAVREAGCGGMARSPTTLRP